MGQIMELQGMLNQSDQARRELELQVLDAPFGHHG
jgi:hypothetical protein